MAAAGRGSGRVRSTWPGQVVKKLPEVGVGDRRIETTQQLGRGLPSLHHRQAMLDQIPTFGVNIMLEFLFFLSPANLHPTMVNRAETYQVISSLTTESLR